MNKQQALHAFWSSFGWTAIDEQSAYDEQTLDQMDIDYPLIAYEVATDEFGAPVAIGANLVDRTTSWAALEQEANEIYERISRGGIMVGYDDGAIWITRGTPFSQRIAPDAKSGILQIHININAEYLSA